MAQGDNGKVYHSYNRHCQYEVAVYITVPREENVRDAVKDGAVILNKLDHPNIVKYYESYIDNETNINFLVMQFIDGFKLFDKI